MEEGWLEQPFSLKNKKIWVAGHNGMVGSALCRKLKNEGCTILSVPRSKVDLCDQKKTRDWLQSNKPDVVVLAAAKVGGVLANDTYPADFLYENLMIEANVIHSACEAGVQKLLFLGSSCIYPKDSKNPIGEDALLSGPLEPTNEAYAIAKIAGVKLCQMYRRQHGCDFISAMPCNLYGPGDSFDAQNSHVIPALMMKAHQAKLDDADIFEVWGTGKPRREFLYVDDLADALVFLLHHYSSSQPINIGAGKDITIAELALMVAAQVDFQGEIRFDESKPDGVFQKLMDHSRITDAGWLAKTPIEEGLSRTYKWYCENAGHGNAQAEQRRKRQAA